MNILITGVAGLIGSRLANHLIEKDITVIGIDDLSGGYIENVNPKVKFYRLNCASKSVESVFKEHKIDYVAHLSAYAAEGLSPFIRCFNYTNNLVATANIVNNCINYDVKRLVFTSSMAVYGQGNPPFSENDPCRPIDSYGIAKRAAEQDIMVAGEQHELDWCIIRPHNVYGVGQNTADKYRNVLGIWMNQHLHGKKLTIFGDGLQTRAFSYIDDILEPLYLAIISEKASKQIINLGGVEETTILAAAKTLIQVIGSGEIEFLEPRHEVKTAYSTFGKSIQLLDFKHQTNLQEGLTKMWAWAQKQPLRESFKWGEYEITKGIYEYWK